MVPWAALLLAVAPLPGAREIPVHEISPHVASSAPLRYSPEGFGVDVDEWVALFLPFQGAEEVELDYRATGHLMLSWGSGKGSSAPSPHGSPWHRTPISPGVGRVTLDLRTTNLWRPERIPFLFLEGTGAFEVTGVRARMASGDPREGLAPLSFARLFAPIRIDHLTINTIDRRPDDAAGATLPLLLGLGFVLLVLLGVVALRARTRSWRLASPIAVAAVATTLAGNLVFAVQAAPAIVVAPAFDPTRRLAAWKDFSPELGPLAALARDQVRPGERVGVLAKRSDWFAWETLCFHLAPRACVQFVPGRAEHTGLQGVGVLRPDQVDVLLVFHPDVPLPAGWTPVAALNSNAYLARRR
ncbi:MAG: hypothetical protein WB493_09725 [Anaeromyxobacteraceae bacterium]